MWSRRNLHLFKGVNQPHKKALERGLAVLKNYQASLEPRNVKKDLLKWEPSPLHSYEINVNAALFFDLEKVGYGVIVYDWRGEIMLVASITKTHIAQPEVMEALAILQGLQLRVNQGLDLIIIESDCMLVVEELTQQQTLSSIYESIIQDIKNLMTCFCNCFISIVVGRGIGLYTSWYTMLGVSTGFPCGMGLCSIF